PGRRRLQDLPDRGHRQGQDHADPDRPGQVRMSSLATTPAKRPTGEILFALVFVSVGVAGLATAGSIPIPPSETGVGPRAFPYIVCGMLVLCGAGIVLQVL